MTKKDLQIKKDIISKTFEDSRKIKHLNTDELNKVKKLGIDRTELVKTDDNEYIYIQIQISDFGIDELSKYCKLAEDIYREFKRKVSIYILCSKNINITVKEFDIKSEAEFTIKLARIDENPSEIILRVIKEKIRNNEQLNKEDLHAISMIPLICDIKDREHYRKEYFKIMNEIL